MTDKTTNTFDVPWIGHPFNSFNLRLVHFNSPLGNLVTKNDPFVNHEVALLPIEHQICFFTSLQNLIKIVETVVKGGSIDSGQRSSKWPKPFRQTISLGTELIKTKAFSRTHGKGS